MTKFNCFTENLAEGAHNFASNVIKVVLTNAANPPLAADTVLADQTGIAVTFLSTSSGVGPTTGFAFELEQSYQSSAGVYRYIPADMTILATGGTAEGFRYIVVYNDTAAGDPLIGWLDYGSDLVLNNGESLVIDINATDGLFTVT